MVSTGFTLQCMLLFSTIGFSFSRGVSYTDSNRKIRHTSGQRESVADNAFSDSNVLARLQSDILDNLGMTELPTSSNQEQVPDFARQLAVEEFTNNQPEEHFMEKSSNLLLIAKKVFTEGVGETIQFLVNAEDRTSRMSEVKLYYYVNSPNITMMPRGSSDKLRLGLSLLHKDENGRTTQRSIGNIEVHRHLIGWHSQQIPSNIITEILNDETIAATSNVTINFHLSCLNCDYQAFPSTMTKENVPFLKVNSRRRRSRRNGLNRCQDGGCCPRELIVDFQAMGWDWVLYPKRYTANYCAGTCSDTPADRATMSSQSHIINAMLSYIRSGRTSSCCVPSSEEFVENFTYVDRTGNIRTSSTTIRTIHSCRCK